MSHELPYKLALIVVLMMMKLARWRSRPLIRWKVSWPALKRDPVDVFILFVVCGVTWSAVYETHRAHFAADRAREALIPIAARAGCFGIPPGC